MPSYLGASLYLAPSGLGGSLELAAEDSMSAACMGASDHTQDTGRVEEKPVAKYWLALAGLLATDKVTPS